MMIVALLQFTAEQYERNFRFLAYGLMTVWIILVAFVVSLAMRERRLRRELERVRLMVEDRERGKQPQPERRA